MSFERDWPSKAMTILPTGAMRLLA